MKNFDVVIVGAGPAGLFTAYELKEKKKDLKVCLIDLGKRAENRICPMKQGHKCMNCNPCQILSGFGGAGTFSDGKLNFIPKLGKSDIKLLTTQKKFLINLVWMQKYIQRTLKKAKKSKEK